MQFPYPASSALRRDAAQHQDHGGERQQRESDREQELESFDNNGEHEQQNGQSGKQGKKGAHIFSMVAAGADAQAGGVPALRTVALLLAHRYETDGVDPAIPASGYPVRATALPIIYS